MATSMPIPSPARRFCSVTYRRVRDACSFPAPAKSFYCRHFAAHAIFGICASNGEAGRAARPGESQPEHEQTVIYGRITNEIFESPYHDAKSQPRMELGCRMFL